MAASFREAKAPFSRQWCDMDKLQGLALWQTYRRDGYHALNIRCQVVTSISEIRSVRILATLLANLQPVVASMSLSSRHKEVASQTPEVLADNFVGNIVGKTTA